MLHPCVVIQYFRHRVAQYVYQRMKSTKASMLSRLRPKSDSLLRTKTIVQLANSSRSIRTFKRKPLASEVSFFLGLKRRGIEHSIQHYHLAAIPFSSPNSPWLENMYISY